MRSKVCHLGAPVTRRALLRAAASLGLLGCGALRAPPSHASALRVGEPAPPAVLVTLQGQRIASTDLLGRVVILTFWATWCSPCRAELPLLSAYARQHAAEGLTVLGFTLDEADALPQVRALAQSFGFPVGLLSQSSVPGYGRIWHIPVNFTIDRSGRLVDDGWRDPQPTWTQARLDRIVTPLLAANR